jgi:GNAT superfamily N-acetyltransferase
MAFLPSEVPRGRHPEGTVDPSGMHDQHHARRHSLTQGHYRQTLPAFRGQGVGSALVTSARQIARQEIGLEHLHLAARGGMGLERFYAKLGWREIGRWPGALRLAAGDNRDEVLMILARRDETKPHHSRQKRMM